MAGSCADCFDAIQTKGWGGICFGWGGKDRRDADVINIQLIGRTGLLEGFDRQANDLIGAQELPGDLPRQVALSYMQTIGIHSQGYVGPIVDDEGYVLWF